MSLVAAAVWAASVFTSVATTAKPRPASPARAASMVALRASRLVWLATWLISSTMMLMRCAAAESASMLTPNRSASLTA